jgi:hypothetical protein
MSKVLSIGALGTGQIKLSYTPQFVGIMSTGGVATDVKNFVITREGSDTLVNTTGTGFQLLANSFTFDSESANHVLLIPVANGYVDGPCTIEGTSALAGFDVYAFSLNKGNTLIRSLVDTIVANQETRYSEFAKLCVSGLSSGDIITIELVDGTTQLMTFEEVAGLGSMIFNNVDDTVVFDNSSQNYKAVRIQPTANRTSFVTKYVL